MSTLENCDTEMEKNDLFDAERKCFQDKRLRNSARGLLVTMLSVSNDAVFHEKRIASFCNDGEGAILDQMKELVMYGYVVRFSVGLYGFYDEPKINKPLRSEQVERIFNGDLSESEFKSIYHQEEDLS